MRKTNKSARTILVSIAEIGILLAVGALAVALVGNDEGERAEESAPTQGSTAKP